MITITSTESEEQYDARTGEFAFKKRIENKGEPRPFEEFAEELKIEL
ncbi:hypothetical protein [Staphylococcus ratti]|uniref:Phage protein n=1 Tax=Staphylococcus ratti TaxID=2892440 RepID=A0ABY3PB39_9STAP|nr:hypothetical protein [Staphylococcus ratti]UEX89527.1 hypothetical protein LN051_08085 [Staphylococcus ratti]